jgi:hypothetical protein
MPKPEIIDQLFELKVRVDMLLAQSEEHDYLDTGDCLDLLNFAKCVLEHIPKPLEQITHQEFVDLVANMGRRLVMDGTHEKDMDTGEVTERQDYERFDQHPDYERR